MATLGDQFARLARIFGQPAMILVVLAFLAAEFGESAGKLAAWPSLLLPAGTLVIVAVALGARYAVQRYLHIDVWDGFRAGLIAAIPAAIVSAVTSYRLANPGEPGAALVL